MNKARLQKRIALYDKHIEKANKGTMKRIRLEQERDELIKKLSEDDGN